MFTSIYMYTYVYFFLTSFKDVGSKWMCEVDPPPNSPTPFQDTPTNPSFSRLQFSHLLAVGVFAFQLLIGVSVNVRVLATEVSISSPADSTLRTKTPPPPSELNARKNNNQKKTYQKVFSKKKKCYLTSDGAVPLWDTLSVDITRVGQTVAAADFWFTALHLIPGETGLAAAAVVGALRMNKTNLVSALNNKCILNVKKKI